jgi:hypothetical protein
MSVRVLLITPRFYGIENRIKSVLEKSFKEVIWLENKTLPLDYHGTNSKMKIFRRIYFFFLAPHKRYLRKELNKIENLKFDILFSINANIICTYLFKRLKKNNPELHSVLYLWDSFSKYNWKKELELFNKVYTFDPVDSTINQIEYKPNFYIARDSDPKRQSEYDLFFVGKFTPERLKTLDKISSLSDSSNLKCFVRLWPAFRIFLHNNFVYSFLKLFKHGNSWVNNYLLNYEAVEGILKREFLVPGTLVFEDVQDKLLSSNVILDLPFQSQAGYTHRLIEALANGKKVITTNLNIKKERFYNPDQIHILDEKEPVIDSNWISEKSAFPVNDYLIDLELEKWLKSIINETAA